MRKIKPIIKKERDWKAESPVMEGSKDVKMKTRKIYPKISIPLTALPEAKDWKVDGKYIVTLELDMTGISFRDQSEMNEYDSEYYNKADFNIIGIEPKSGGKKSKKSGEKLEKVSGRYMDDESEDED